MGVRLRKCLVLVAFAVAGCRHEKSALQFPNAPVIIISIDTLRADHLPAYGYKGVATPNIDALRRDGILFENAWSHVPLTLPSHVSMLTGALPQDNGVRNNIGYVFDASAHPTIPSVLHESGYTTGAAVSAYVLRGATGLRNAFDFYDDAIAARAGVAQGDLQRAGGDTEAVASRWIGQNEAKPFFFLLHLFEPHAPYTPPEPFRSRFANPYDGEIATADAIVGTFLENLKQKKIYDRALIVLISDHGEGLGDHGEDEHGIFLYRESLHVPLIVKLPSSTRAGESIARPAGLIDIFPTVLAVTGIEPKQKLRGESLLNAAAPARSLYAESLYPRIHLGWSELRSLADDRYHFISAPSPELYDYTRDTGERTNVLGAERRIYSRMRGDLAAYGTAVPEPAAHIDPEEAKKLAALGYLTSSAAKAGGPLPDPKNEIGQLTAMKRAGSLERSGDGNGAIEIYRSVLAQNPRFTDALNALGDALERAGRYEEATEVYRKAIANSPELAGELGLRLGTLLMRLGRFDEARQHAVLSERTNLPAAKLLEAKIAVARGDLTSGAADAEAARGDSSTEAAALVLLARIAAQQNRIADAASLIGNVDALRAQRHLDSVEDLELVRGEILARSDRFDEAVAAFQRETVAFPGDKQAFAELALLYAAAGRPADARSTLETMVRANPNRPAMLLAAKTAKVFGDDALAAEWTRRAK